MITYTWPHDLCPTEQTWRILDTSAVFASPLSGAMRVYARPGMRMGCKLSFRNVGDIHPSKYADMRARIQGIIGALNGRENSIYLSNTASMLRGSFPADELLTNTLFEKDASGWASSNAELTLTADSNRLRLTRAGVGSNRTAYHQQLNLTGAALFRATILPGRGGFTGAVSLGTTTTGENITTTTPTTHGAFHVSASVAGNFYANVRYNSSGRSVGDFVTVESPSVSRCALVNGAGQTGSAVWLSALPASKEGLLRAGDMVSIYTTRWEMKIVTGDLNSNASGNGQLTFSPPLQNPLSNNAPVAIHRPMGRFMLLDAGQEWTTRAGKMTDFDLDFVEDLR